MLRWERGAEVREGAEVGKGCCSGGEVLRWERGAEVKERC